MDPLTIQSALRNISGIGQLGGNAEIRPIQPQPSVSTAQPTGALADTSFEDTLAKYLNDVNDQVLAADQGMADLAAGKSQNIHNTLIAMQKADLQVKLLVETRNKVISAYQEIMRMQA